VVVSSASYSGTTHYPKTWASNAGSVGYYYVWMRFYSTNRNFDCDMRVHQLCATVTPTATPPPSTTTPPTAPPGDDNEFCSGTVDETISAGAYGMDHYLYVNGQAYENSYTAIAHFWSTTTGGDSYFVQFGHDQAYTGNSAVIVSDGAYEGSDPYGRSWAYDGLDYSERAYYYLWMRVLCTNSIFSCHIRRYWMCATLVPTLPPDYEDGYSSGGTSWYIWVAAAAGGLVLFVGLVAAVVIARRKRRHSKIDVAFTDDRTEPLLDPTSATA